MDNQLIEESIKEAKERIKSTVKKDKLIMFFTRVIEDLKNNPNADVFGRFMEMYYYLNPYQKKNREEIYKYFQNIKQGDGLILNDVELSYMKILIEELNEDFTFKNGKIMKGRIKGMLDKLVQNYLQNTYKLLDSYTIGKLICSIGGIDNLVTKPSSTIQLIGAEKALFRHNKLGSKPPKYGLLYYTKEIQQAKNKGKVARQLSNKLSIAIKVDYFTNFAR